MVTSSPSSRYAARLAAAWADALAPREPGAPTVISTFAGGGGSSTGYHMAGYRELLAVEWDAHACATLRANYPSLDVYEGDIAQLTVADVLERTGLQPGELDVLDGSPPCQGFSTVGKRQIDDPRNQLYREYTRLLDGLRPRAFVMENVTGMVKGKMAVIFAEILADLKAKGYRVRCWKLNASYYGVPQMRERMIFIGLRDDLGIDPTPPAPETHPVTFRDGVAGLTDLGEIVRPTGKAAELVRRMRPGEHGGHVNERMGLKGNNFSLSRAEWDRPCYTILKSVGHRGAFSGVIHPSEDRFLTIPEVKRVSSFPDAYALDGEFDECWARLGNAVPPLLMRAVARHVRALLEQPIP